MRGRDAGGEVPAFAGMTVKGALRARLAAADGERDDAAEDRRPDRGHDDDERSSVATA